MAPDNPFTTCLWFNGEAEQAAEFYTSIFTNSKILNVSRYGDGALETHGREPGSAMTVVFEANGQRFMALNGGPQFSFSPAVSLIMHCDDQAEVDHYWATLGHGGTESRCGWLRDKFGFSWQVVPKALARLLGSDDRAAANRAMVAMMDMQKLDIARLEAAFAGRQS